MSFRRKVSLLTVLLFVAIIFIVLTLWGQVTDKQNITKFIQDEVEQKLRSGKIIENILQRNGLKNTETINMLNSANIAIETLSNNENNKQIETPLNLEQTGVNGKVENSPQGLQNSQLGNMTPHKVPDLQVKKPKEAFNPVDLPKVRKQEKFVYFTDQYPIKDEPLRSWTSDALKGKICDTKVTIYSGRYAVGHGITMYPLNRHNYLTQAKGGEEVKNVLNQQLDKEDYSFKSDFWEVPCSSNNGAENAQLLYWIKNIKIDTADSPINFSAVNHVRNYTIGIRRQDYANLHNWVRNIYNTFVILMHFNIQPSDISILFLDGHPFTYLDKAWETIYTAPIRLGHMTKPVYYENFIWGYQENKGPITERAESDPVPYLEEFRTFVLSRHNLVTKDTLDCKKLRITLIVRRNAVYHPRNIEGKVGRKIFNEAEIIDMLTEAFPTATVQAVLMESLPMKKQLEISSNTDIWIGMHGAGMSHIVFLPKHAAVLELFALGFKTGRPWFICFHSITGWRGMKYDSWENFDKSLEMPHDFTIVPVDIVRTKTLNLAKQICPNL